MDAEMVSYLVGILGLGGVIFGIYNHFKEPQNKLEKEQALAERTTDGKAALLAQNLQWEKESNERRFSEMQINIKEAMTLAQNHIHSIDVRVTDLARDVSTMAIAVQRLSTIIEERDKKD